MDMITLPILHILPCGHCVLLFRTPLNTDPSVLQGNEGERVSDEQGSSTLPLEVLHIIPSCTGART